MQVVLFLFKEKMDEKIFSSIKKSAFTCFYIRPPVNEVILAP